MAPAIELASKGFTIFYAHSEQLKNSRSLSKNPESKHIFQKDSAFYEVGDTFKQPDLARTLERISKVGGKEL
jgi:gamma-glutamyltranspeptidase/glutathione hydrolase